MKPNKLPTQEELKKAFFYDAETGVLFWKETSSFKTKHGDVAGCINKRNGYSVVRLNNQLYRTHRVIYKLYHGDFEESKQIDHIDRCKVNNRIQNLRAVSHRDNNLNKVLNKNNTSGTRGVCYCKQTNKWQAQIKVYGKNKDLGRFENILEAIKARGDAERRYGYTTLL